MDRVGQLRGEAGDSTLDTTSPPSEAYMSANDASSKYFSLSDSTFDMTPIKDVSLASTSADPEITLSPIGNKDVLDSYKIGKQIEAANILSGGVNIFDDNDNSFDGDELVIDDNVDIDDKSNPDKTEMGDVSDPALVGTDVASKDMEVMLQIDGKNVNAIDIGNGLYLYRKDGQEELAAVQIIDGDQPQPSFKFLKVRENAEGNLEVYEEIEIEVPKEVPAKEKKMVDKNTPHVPVVDINKVMSDSNSKVSEKSKSPQKENVATTSTENVDNTESKEKEVNFNSKMKLSESRKSPVVGSFTPMTFHSTPNKEGKPLTKTMVDLQLDPNRHTDNVKKTIEVHTDTKQKPLEPSKENSKLTDTTDKNTSQESIQPQNKQGKEQANAEKVNKKISEISALGDEQEKSDNIKENVSEGGNIVKDDKNNSQENKNVQDACISITNAETDKKSIPKEDTNAQHKDDTNKLESVKALKTDNIPSKVDKGDVTKNNLDKTINDVKIIKESTDTSVKKDDDVKDLNTSKEIQLDKTEIDNSKLTLDIASNNDKIENKNNTPSSEIPEKREIKMPDLEIKLSKKIEELPSDEAVTHKPIMEIKAVSKSEEPKTSVLENTVLNIFKDEPNEKAKIEKVTAEPVSSDSISVSTGESTSAVAKQDFKKIDSSTPNENIVKAKPKEVANKRNEKVELKDQVHSTTEVVGVTNISIQENKDSQSNEKLKNTDDLPSKEVQDVKIKSSGPEPDSIKLPEGLQCVPMPKTLPDNLSSIPVLKNTVKPQPAVHASTKTTDKSKPVAPKLLDKTTPHLPVPNIKPELIKPISVPKVNPSEAGDILVAKSKISAPSIPVMKVKSTEPIGHIANIKAVESKQTISIPKVKSVEFSGQPLPLPIVKTTESTLKIGGHSSSMQNITKADSKVYPVSHPAAVHSTAKIEVKTQEDSKLADKTTKPNVQLIETKHYSKDQEIKPVPKLENIKNNEPPANKDTKSKVVDKKNTEVKPESRDSKEVNKLTEQKPVNNNHTAAVPFGKWTEVNRQEFLNKFKEVKAPVNSNTKQIKNSNDLNRRDVLKKIDSQRQTIINNAISKAQEKSNIKNETVFSSKIVPDKKETKTVPDKKETKVIPKNEIAEVKSKQAPVKVILKADQPQKPVVSSTVTITAAAAGTKAEPPRKDLSTATVASLIDRTIEDMITRVVPVKSDEDKKTEVIELNAPVQNVPQKLNPKPAVNDSGTLDDIEMKMNELHGIPFVERPPHQLPKVSRPELKTYSKSDKASKTTKATSAVSVEMKSETKISKDNLIDLDSDDEVIEHEPVTGDMELNKKSIPTAQKDRTQTSQKGAAASASNDTSKKAVITENEFDKFARRNSITYENCLKVNFDKKDPHTIIQTVKEKELPVKPIPKTEPSRLESKSKLPHKQPLRQNVHVSKASSVAPVDASNKHHSKIHSAYQALTATRPAPAVNPPITILEDKPVKVVFVDSSTEFVTSQLNVQGQELSPPKKVEAKVDIKTNSNTSSVDSDALEVSDENRHDKIKTKHQRKQVLTPVEAPELELIQPSDLEASPKKKRKIDENRTDRQPKNLVHKKSYLLGRNSTTDNKNVDQQVVIKDSSEERNITQIETIPEIKHAVSAIDSLVKAAELLENQSETLNQSIVSSNADSPQNTPVKRGRGRPRKYPLPEGSVDKKPSTPQKKPRLIDAKPVKRDSISDDDIDSDEDMVRENWTMGKINENIVCPICNKLFRSENVVFKHVKHCTGVSPNRSESDTSPRRERMSQDFDDIDEDENSSDEFKKKRQRKRKSKESAQVEAKSDHILGEVDKDDIIVIEDTPVKEKPEKLKHDKEKTEEASKVSKVKVSHRNNNISCEICGKTFRQQSYLANHKLQHKKDQQTKKVEKESQNSNKLQVFSCEVCKKEFRKLHHLVQHRIIHNPNSAPTRSLRKSSSEQNDAKNIKEDAMNKQNDDQNAAFRCEPCDKSFRKLHHLVEHRETHDGINRQKTSAPVQPPIEKPDPPPQCEICKKTFRKLHHLIEHKEQHADVVSDKSDDKSESVKSALSTKDIIHECSLCYMVFPNEHSLNKHSTLCAKKKRQSKQPKDNVQNESEKKDDKLEDNNVEVSKEENSLAKPKVDQNVDNIQADKDVEESNKKEDTATEVEIQEVIPEVIEIKENDHDVSEKTAVINSKQQNETSSISETQSGLSKRNLETEKVVEKSVVPEKIQKIEHKESNTTLEPLKKKTPLKNKTTPTVTKRQKSTEAPAEPKTEKVPAVESSDDDDVRYMLNPNYVEDLSESKKFMKVRASKRSSLQIERTTPKESAIRRPSLQHPPRIPRSKPKIDTKFKNVELKAKPIETKMKSKPEPKLKPIAKPAVQATVPKVQEVEAVLSTDSDDSDVKYSFAKSARISTDDTSDQEKTVGNKVPRKLSVEKRKSSVEKRKSSVEKRKSSVEKRKSSVEKRKSSVEKLKSSVEKRKSSVEKRTSLGGVSKRKSLVKTVVAKQKVNVSPVKIIRKRGAPVEHRCDCGALFGSAALLSRHTTLAHTPPRIRRRRSSPTPPALTKKTTPKNDPKPPRKSNPQKNETRKPKSEPKIVTKMRPSRTDSKKLK